MINNNIKTIEQEITELESIDYSSLDKKDNMNFATYGYVEAFKTVIDQLNQSNKKHFLAGILAGIWIGIAYTACAYATYTLEGSAYSFIFGLTFAGVIILITFLGGGFVTAFMYMNYPLLRGATKWSIYLKACLWVYLGNALGVLLIVSIVQLSGAFINADNGQLNKLGEFVQHKFGYGKISLIGTELDRVVKYEYYKEFNSTGETTITVGKAFGTIGFIFASGILCNFLICLATQGAKSSKGSTGVTVFMYLLILFFFAIGGYQHCVANWYGAWFLVTNSIMHHATWQEIAAGWLYIGFNIIPAILGNWVGALIIGFLMAKYNSEQSELLIKKYRLKTLKNIK